MTDVEIRYRGRLALTSRRAARRWGIPDEYMRQLIHRRRLAACGEGVDDRTALYPQVELDKMMRAANFKRPRTTEED